MSLTVEFYGSGEAHAGLLIVPVSLPGKRPDWVAHALKRWSVAREDHPESVGPYHVEFIRSEG